MTIMQKCADFIFLGELCIKILSICIFGMRVGWGLAVGDVLFFNQTILNRKKKPASKDYIKNHRS